MGVKCWTAGLLVIAFILHQPQGKRLRSDALSIPKVRGRLPGNIDILWQLVYNESHEYCGEILRKWAEIYGPTYDMNILWGHQVQQLAVFPPDQYLPDFV